MRLGNSLLAVLLAAHCVHSIGADSPAEPRVRLVVQRAIVAGVRYHQAAALWPVLRVGMPVSLVREPENPHDASAIRVEVAGGSIGYLSRRDNPALAWALDNGQPIHGRVERLEKLRNGVRRVEIEVYAE